MAMHNPARPGELLRAWIEGANLTVTLLADRIGVTRATLSRIIDGLEEITADIDFNLHQVLGSRIGLWLDLQAQRNFWLAT